VKNDDLEAGMRELEWFHDLRVLPATWPVIRVDGRSFTRLAERQQFERPFDARFHEMMVKTAEALLAELHGAFAFTESDEISVLLPADTQLFNREVEKLVSVSAGIASATFALQLGNAAHFDSRVWVGPIHRARRGLSSLAAERRGALLSQWVVLLDAQKRGSNRQPGDGCARG
jgi:tRNA(His) guanylyltransferase